jgi:protein-disulfide isomerase
VNRQRLLAAAIICALISAFAYFGHGASPNLAAKSAVPASAEPVPLRDLTTTVRATGNAAMPISSKREKPAVLKTVEAAALPPAPQTAPVVSDVDPHKAFGSKNAPVIMEVFSDFQCPACKTLFTTTNRPLMDDYVSNGKVYLIHRDFPLPMHAHSRVAARYARAAAQIGKTEPAEQVLFQNQEKWEQSGDVDGTVASVLSLADMTKVRALVKGGTLENLIDKDYALGQGYRVSQTPTTIFHCKGQTYPYSGVMSYDILKQFLDQLLSQK